MAGTICSSSKQYFSEMSALLARIPCEPIDQFAGVVYRAWKDHKRIFVFGNGGSCSTASHMVCDLVKTACVPGKRRIDAQALVDNLPMITALGNDESYADVFSFPLESWATKGDVAVAITCSGNSPNLLKAAKWARENGVTVVALTGFSGGKLAGIADWHVNVPSENYGLIEDVHLSIGHIVAQMFKSRVSQEAEAA